MKFPVPAIAAQDHCARLYLEDALTTYVSLPTYLVKNPQGKAAMSEVSACKKK